MRVINFVIVIHTKIASSRDLDVLASDHCVEIGEKVISVCSKVLTRVTNAISRAL